jgi:hypothetical protein
MPQGIELQGHFETVKLGLPFYRRKALSVNLLLA